MFPQDSFFGVIFDMYRKIILQITFLVSITSVVIIRLPIQLKVGVTYQYHSLHRRSPNWLDGQYDQMLVWFSVSHPQDLAITPQEWEVSY